MYDWLADALDDGVVVTANRRLARELSQSWSRQQAAAGKSAWLSPNILSWQAWVLDTLEKASLFKPLPLRINQHQSLALWQTCIRPEIDADIAGLPGLAREAWRTWLRLADWQIPLDTVSNAARTADQRIFVRAARRYEAELADRGWIDESCLMQQLVQAIQDSIVDVPGQLTLAGFDRLTPQVEGILEALKARGAQTKTVTGDKQAECLLARFDDDGAEFRSAGAWARQELKENPGQKLAIVASNLEQDAERIVSLVREGFVPGWQHGGDAVKGSVNVSYGRKLIEYPAITTALLFLRWISEPIRSAELSVLLRSSHFGSSENAERARTELRLRDLPDQAWSIPLFQRLTERKEEGLTGFRRRLAESVTLVDTERRKPSEWAELIDLVLKTMGWPGESSLASDEFQLLNRWRELLNDYVRLSLVLPSQDFAQVVRTLSSLAADTLFQPEQEGVLLDVIGPLEAAGQQFDKLWIAGCTREHWPPPSRPLAMISTALQREHGMPDADSQDTAAYAERILGRLARSARQCIFSFPKWRGDSEQAVSALLPEHSLTNVKDPGWFAGKQAGNASVSIIQPDIVPPVGSAERIYGGSSVVDWQYGDPITAFARGRLAANQLAHFDHGLQAVQRGNLVHRALQCLYRDNPSQSQISNWSAEERTQRVSDAVQASFAASYIHVDETVRQLLRREQRRCENLLQAVIDLDSGRPDFEVESVETEADFQHNGVHLLLRIDRIDRNNDGQLLIFDYKTGQRKSFLSKGEPASYQLVTYALSSPGEIGGLGLFNVDSRELQVNGVGDVPNGKPMDDIDAWKATVLSSIERFARGDVRINARQGIDDARPLALLSRYAELADD